MSVCAINDKWKDFLCAAEMSFTLPVVLHARHVHRGRLFYDIGTHSNSRCLKALFFVLSAGFGFIFIFTLEAVGEKFARFSRSTARAENFHPHSSQ